MSSSDSSNQDTAEEIKPPEERARDVIEQKGGLPDDNPFTDFIHHLHDEGNSWGEIRSYLQEVFDVVDEAGYEFELEMTPVFEVTVDLFPHTDDPEYETHSIWAETADDARDRVESDEDIHGEIVEVEQTGVAKF